MSKLIIVVMVLCVGLASLAWEQALASDGTAGYDSPRLSAVVSDWVGHESLVICSPLPRGMYGWAEPEFFELTVNRRFCQPLYALLGGKEILQRRTADGLLTLAHESRHLMGDYSEPHTECVAMQTTDDLALKMGASARWAYVLGRTAFRLSMDFQAVAPPYRDWRRCRQNGAWDLSPGDGLWP